MTDEIQQAEKEAMKLNVKVQVEWRSEYTSMSGTREETQEREVDAVRVRAYSGCGTAQLFYQARDSRTGEWYPFLKKDNKGKKLPTVKAFTTWTNELTDVRGIRPCYRSVSNVVELPASPENNQ